MIKFLFKLLTLSSSIQSYNLKANIVENIVEIVIIKNKQKRKKAIKINYLKLS